jgi:hypothetical protein
MAKNSSLTFVIARFSFYFVIYFCYFQIYYSKKAKDMKEAQKIAENEQVRISKWEMIEFKLK